MDRWYSYSKRTERNPGTRLWNLSVRIWCEMMLWQFLGYRELNVWPQHRDPLQSFPRPETCSNQLSPVVAKYLRVHHQYDDKTASCHGITASRPSRRKTTGERNQQIRFLVVKRVRMRRWQHPVPIRANTSSKITSQSKIYKAGKYVLEPSMA